MFQRKRIDYDDKNGSSYYGLNVPNNKVATKKNPGRVYIAMPQNLRLHINQHTVKLIWVLLEWEWQWV